MMKRLKLHFGLLIVLFLLTTVQQVHSANFYYNYGFIWSEETGLTNLGTLGGSGYSYATAINNNEEVVLKGGVKVRQVSEESCDT